MSSQQQQQQSKRERSLSASPSPSPSPAPDESGQTQPQTKKAKVDDDENIDDDKVLSHGRSHWNDQHEQARAESERECYICLEDLCDQRGEGIITPCGHVFCAECWGYWVEWLQELGVEVRCPECKGVVESVETW